MYSLSNAFDNNEYDVLVEGIVRNRLFGRTEGDKLVYIQDGDESMIGNIHKTKIIEISSYSLIGEKF